MFVVDLPPGKERFFKDILVSPHLISSDGELCIFLHDLNKILFYPDIKKVCYQPTSYSLQAL